MNIVYLGTRTNVLSFNKLTDSLEYLSLKKKITEVLDLERDGIGTTFKFNFSGEKKITRHV